MDIYTKPDFFYECYVKKNILICCMLFYKVYFDEIVNTFFF